MSTYTELCGVINYRDGVSRADVVACVRQAVGEGYRRVYFPEETVLQEDCIDFGCIPPDGAHTQTIEQAILAIAPLVENGQIECVPGMNWADAWLYRLVDGQVESAGATFCANSEWLPVQAVEVPHG